MLAALRTDMDSAQRHQMNALSSLNQTLMDKVQACQDMSIAQSQQIQELLKALGQSLSNQVSTIQTTVANNHVKNDRSHAERSAEQSNVTDNEIKRHVENLCSLAKEREGCVESEQAQEIIDELQELLSLFSALRKDEDPDQHGGKRKAEHNDKSEVELPRKKKKIDSWRKLTGLMASTDAIQLNGQD